LESAWDALNVGMGIASFVDNVKQGNYGWAAVDALGVVVDAAALVTPIVPGGVGAIIKGARAADTAVDAIQTVNQVSNAAQAANQAANVAQGAQTVARHADEVVQAGVGAGSSGVPSTVYATGNASGPRPPRIEGYNVKPNQTVDIQVSASGNIIPGAGGASTWQTIDQIPTRGHVWQLNTGAGTPGFNVKPDGIPFGPNPPGHVSLIPNKVMTPEHCISCYQRLNWQPVMDNGRHLKR
jgi:hypothetical protein